MTSTLTTTALTAAELARAEEKVNDLATYWLLEPAEIKGLLFVRELVAEGRLGKDDRN